MRQIKRFGWKPDHPDQRDYKFAPRRGIGSLPPSASVRSMMPPVYNQGDLGSCTANAWAGVVEYTQKWSNQTEFTPSRLFIYYYERLLDGTVSVDSGAQLRDGAKVVSSYGAPPESLWPYSDKDPGSYQTQPTPEVLAAAKLDLITSYERIPDGDLMSMKAAIACGKPFVGGITVYDSFPMDAHNADTAVVPAPQGSSQVIGGHAIAFVGYDDNTHLICFRNSWGEGWGDGGYGYLNYSYMQNSDLASDFWLINTVTETPSPTA